MDHPLQSNYTVDEMDRASHLHPVTSIQMLEEHGPTMFGNASGVTVEGPGGVSMIDFGAGLWCVNAGYGREELIAAGAEAMRDLSYFHCFGGASNAYAARLAETLLGLLREKAGARHMSKVFFGLSGSDANDSAYKLVRYLNNLRGKPQKKKFLSRLGAYHGLTYAAAGLTGIPGYHRAFDLPQNDVIHLACPHAYRYAQGEETEAEFAARLLAELERTIAREGADTIGAMILEPIMGTGGVLIPPENYLRGVQQILKDNDILMIVDEVITGFGRLGSWFGTGHFELEPDIVTLAKGVTSAYFPMSCTVISEAIYDSLREASPKTGSVMHGFTYSGHPVGCAIGLANLELMAREGLVENAANAGPLLVQRLQERVGDHPFIGDIRGVGLMAAVELVADRETRRFFAEGQEPHKRLAVQAMQEGVLVRGLPFIEVVSFSPPLSITDEQITEGVDRFASALEKATPALEVAARA
ncbi:MAG: aminotransferase class III-fold pyridoxal phosphate-dependent enzyme [Roseitalea sp.]|jgi:L-2,4-diaminobutyrate transaminase|nr:aminotransferase class III-fold pyridoxal phosphate-dependent enzyme [Roseitalea sp.]